MIAESGKELPTSALLVSFQCQRFGGMSHSLQPRKKEENSMWGLPLRSGRVSPRTTSKAVLPAHPPISFVCGDTPHPGRRGSAPSAHPRPKALIQARIQKVPTPMGTPPKTPGKGRRPLHACFKRAESSSPGCRCHPTRSASRLIWSRSGMAGSMISSSIPTAAYSFITVLTSSGVKATLRIAASGSIPALE